MCNDGGSSSSTCSNDTNKHFRYLNLFASLRTVSNRKSITNSNNNDNAEENLHFNSGLFTSCVLLAVLNGISPRL